ncbi:MAG: hypothetical protein JKY53_07740, partial [Flavobacteriales bacterium]|nr:hypothetical protein [Flavobacteriales bacterium]
MNTNQKSFKLLTLLFFMWGFITVSNDILINAFKDIFDLSAPQRALIQFAFFGAFFFVSLIYFLVSSYSGKDPINKIGYKLSMTVSLVVCGIGCLLFYPAAQLESYYSFLAALFILASGGAAPQQHHHDRRADRHDLDPRRLLLWDRTAL